jgi:large subunit ribosomal protein L23
MGFINKVLKKDDKDTKTSKIKEAKVEIEKDKAAVATVVSPKKENVAKTPAVVLKKKEDLEAFKILQKPVITEKATSLGQLNKYEFKVPASTNKSEVAKKILNVYGIKPIKINMIKVAGKKVRRGRVFGQTKVWKKAIVTLPAEHKIEIYEGV